MIEIVKHGDSTLSCKCPECGWEFRFPLGRFIKFDSTGPVLTVERFPLIAQIVEQMFMRYGTPMFWLMT